VHTKIGSSQRQRNGSPNVGRIKEHEEGNLEEGGEDNESARRLKSSGIDIQQCSYFI
jgi:hypothetical protein